MPWKRVVGWLALPMGVIGMAACGVAAYAATRLAARLEQAADRGFDAVDTGLAFAEDRTRGTLERVREADAATRRAADAVGGWAARSAAERLATRRILDRLGESVAGHLHSADLRLEAATASVRHGRQLLSVAGLLGAPTDPAVLEELVNRLTGLRGRLAEAEQAVGDVRAVLAGEDDDLTTDRRARLTKLLAAVAAAVSDVDTRLEAVVRRISEAEAAAPQWRTSAGRSIGLATAASYLLLAWVAVGQATLAMWGRARAWTPRRLSA